MESLLSELKSFIDLYQSSTEVSLECEEIRPLLSALETELPSIEIEIYLSKVIKILFRSPSNRKAIGKFGMMSIVRCLHNHARSIRGVATGEIGNVVLNACYNGENVDIFVEMGGTDPLCALLMTSDLSITACILGAIQGICYVPSGRFDIRRNIRVLQRTANLLNCSDDIVRARAAGCIHNLSADNVSIAILREINCIPALTNLLREHSPEVCQAAAGTLQNMSREVASRELILGTNAVPLLVDLLFSNDLKCQVATIGALLNLLGPSLDREGMDLLRETLTNGLVLGTIESCVFEPTR